MLVKKTANIIITTFNNANITLSFCYCVAYEDSAIVIFS